MDRTLRRVLFFRAVLVALVGISTSACTSLSISSMGPLIESPEVQEKLELGFGFEPTAEYLYTSDASARPPTLNNPEVTTPRLPYVRGGYVVIPGLELGLRLMTGGTFLIGGIGGTARYQVIGDKGPGLCMSVYGGAYYMATSMGGDQRGIFGPGGHNWQAKVNSDTSTGGASIGYRFEGGTLVFVAASYANQAINGSIHHDLSSDGSSPAADYTLDSIKGNTRAAALGVRIGEKIIFQIDTRYLDRSFPGNVPSNRGGGQKGEGVFALGLFLR